LINIVFLSAVTKISLLRLTYQLNCERDMIAVKTQWYQGIGREKYFFKNLQHWKSDRVSYI
jgi:hypothetical protein